jgi:multidrug resistance efflux pump
MNKKRHPIENVDIYGEQVREILNQPPHWLTLSGSTLIFIFIISAMCLAYLVKYPDVLRASVTITASNPPVQVIAQVDGRIEQILVEDNDKVKKNEVLARIENTAKAEDVSFLESKLKNFHSQLDDTSNPLLLPNELELGSIQDVFALFKYDYEVYHSYLHTNGTSQNIHLLRRQLVEHSTLLEKQKTQQINIEDELKILQVDVDRNQHLYEQGVISLKDLEDKQKELLRLNNSKENILIDQSTTQIAITGFRRNILDIQSGHIYSKEQLRFKVIESYQVLWNAITEWKRQFIITSPIEGIVSYFNYWSNNQNIKRGEEVFTILPDSSSVYIGKALLPIQNTGKLRLGQKALVKLENYPHAEFGILTGVVKHISSIPKQGFYAIELSFAQPLKTSTGLELRLKDELAGEVEIITEDLRILERVFYQLRKAFKQ